MKVAFINFDVFQLNSNNVKIMRPELFMEKIIDI